MLGQVKSKRNYGKEIYKARETKTRYMCDLCDKKTPFEHITGLGEVCIYAQSVTRSLARCPGAKTRTAS